MVKLAESHSLDEHFNYIGQDFSATLTTGHWSDFDWMPLLHCYFIRIDETFVNPHIRKDPGVEWVDQNRALDDRSVHVNETVEPTDYVRPLAPSSPFSVKKTSPAP